MIPGFITTNFNERLQGEVQAKCQGHIQKPILMKIHLPEASQAIALKKNFTGIWIGEIAP